MIPISILNRADMRRVQEHTRTDDGEDEDEADGDDPVERLHLKKPQSKQGILRSDR